MLFGGQRLAGRRIRRGLRKLQHLCRLGLALLRLRLRSLGLALQACNLAVETLRLRLCGGGGHLRLLPELCNPLLKLYPGEPRGLACLGKLRLAAPHHLALAFYGTLAAFTGCSGLLCSCSHALHSLTASFLRLRLHRRGVLFRRRELLPHRRPLFLQQRQGLLGGGKLFCYLRKLCLSLGGAFLEQCRVIACADELLGCLGNFRLQPFGPRLGRLSALKCTRELFLYLGKRAGRLLATLACGHEVLLRLSHGARRVLPLLDSGSSHGALGFCSRCGELVGGCRGPLLCGLGRDLGPLELFLQPRSSFPSRCCLLLCLIQPRLEVLSRHTCRVRGAHSRIGERSLGDAELRPRARMLALLGLQSRLELIHLLSRGTVRGSNGAVVD
mmetsp:Transcript_4194/g.16842  ORF Transcript_4194/g.16842 Transcript_4194/m.16842 type:complete len:386 (-) Transcript_4194:1093-2250(-)